MAYEFLSGQFERNLKWPQLAVDMWKPSKTIKNNNAFCLFDPLQFDSSRSPTELSPEQFVSKHSLQNLIPGRKSIRSGMCGMLLVPNIRLDNKIDTRLRRIDCRPNPQSTVHCRKPTRCCISLTFRCLGHMSFQVQVHVFAYYEIIWICRCTLPPSQTAFTKKMKCGMQRKKTLPNLWSLSLATRYTAILGIFHFGSLFWFFQLGMMTMMLCSLH